MDDSSGRTCETLSCDSSRARLGQTLLYAFLHFRDLNKVGSASCNTVVHSRKPDRYRSIRRDWHYGDLSVARNSKIYLGLHVKCPIFLRDFNQILFFLTDILKSLKYRISQKSVRWDPHPYCGQKAGHDEGKGKGKLRPVTSHEGSEGE